MLLIVSAMDNTVAIARESVASTCGVHSFT
jgi:hypothetical protein